MTIGIFSKAAIHSARGMKKLAGIIQKRSRSSDKVFLKKTAAKKYVKTLQKGNILQRQHMRSSIQGVQNLKSGIKINPSKSNLGIAKQFSRMGKTAQRKKATRMASIVNPRIDKQGGLLTSRKNYRTITKMSQSPEYSARIMRKFIV
tara:strand:- start:42 stop:482 length:441 start_codon:yes stop_codon:yes gene_type:complete